MSFLVKPILSVCHSCHTGKFTFKDVTGPWDATLNPYGWAPDNSGDNIEIGQVESSALTITSPSGVVYGPYNILASIPALDGVGHEIDLEDILGSGDTVPYEDGYWSFDWVVKGVYGDDDTLFHARCLKEILPLCDVQCCVDKLTADSDPSCGCSKTGNKKAVNAMLTLEGILGANRCGKKERAKTLLANLQAICTNNCKNC